jgi:alpha-mannosidase
MTTLRKVVVVFKTHFDLGFTGLPDEVMRQYTGPMFDAVRRVMVATENEPENVRYSWTLPAWPLRFLLSDPSVSEESREAARRLVEEGRLHWHAWPFTTHTAFCSLEELVRGLHISRGLSEEFGRWPSAAKQTDVPGHTWILPTLLARAGVKFLHLGANPGSHTPHVPRLFWWEGPDGSRLLTYYSPGGYGTPLLPPDDWTLDTWLAVAHTSDNTGPQSPEELARIRRTIEEGAPGVEVLFGQLGDFAESLLERPEQLDDLPVVSQDLADTWIHGIGTYPREVARVRELRGKLLDLEMAAAAYDWPGEEGSRDDFPLARAVAPLIDAAYEQLLLFGEHTWGLDVKSTIKRVFGEGFKAARQTEPYRRLEESWRAKAAYVDRAEELYAQAARLVAEAKPKPTPQEETELDRLLAGIRPIVAADSTPDNVLEDGSFRLEVDPQSGGIVSLVAKNTGHEWVDRSASEPFGGYRYDIYSIGDIAEFMRAYGLYFQDWFVHDFGKQGYPEDSQHITAYARDFKLEKVHSEQGTVLRLTGGRLRATGSGNPVLPEQTISIEISLGVAGHQPQVDIEYRVEGKEAIPLAESTVVPFPLNIRTPTFLLGQTGSVIDPAHDVVEGANRYLWCADWLYTSKGNLGMSVIAEDMPLFGLGDPGIYRFDPARVPTEPVVYAHLSNTQWGTNFPQWLEGDFRWRVHLMPDIGRGWLGSLASSTPALTVITALHTPLHVQRGRVLSVRPRHDGRGLIMRIWEPRGGYGRLWVSPTAPVSAIWTCDLMERPVERVRIEDGPSEIDIPITPHGIVTLLIEFDQPAS